MRSPVLILITAALVFVFLSPASAQGDAKQVDSLIQRLPKVHDTVKFDILMTLSQIAPEGVWQKYNQDLKKLALKYLNSNEKNKNPFYHAYATALNNEAFDYVERGNYTRAIELYQECAAIHLKLKNNRGLSLNYSNLGAIYDRDGDIEHAIEYNTKALELGSKTDSYGVRIAALNNLGALYSRQHDSLRSKEAYLQAYRIYEKYLPSTNAISTIVGNLSASYAKFHQYDSADYFNRIALQLATDQDNVKGLSAAYTNYGDRFERLNQPDSAIYYYDKAYTIAKKITTWLTWKRSPENFMHSIKQREMMPGHFFSLRKRSTQQKN